jgi:CPA2 family monovalent cation:H+ antiporter-2
VSITALMRAGRRILAPAPETRLEADDVVVLFGSAEALTRVESRLLG